MSKHPSIACRLATAFTALAPGLVCAAPTSTDTLTVAAGLYDITTETVLPHLEDNLRDAKTRTQQCLGRPNATSLFPLLRHQAFTGCALTRHGARDDEETFTLVCANPQAATGQARFRVGAASLEGVLELKMGGKNMTLSQRIRGPRIGACR